MEVCESTCVQCGRMCSRPGSPQRSDGHACLPPDSQWDVYQAAICQSGVLTRLFPCPWFDMFLVLHLTVCKSEWCRMRVKLPTRSEHVYCSPCHALSLWNKPPRCMQLFHEHLGAAGQKFTNSQPQSSRVALFLGSFASLIETKKHFGLTGCCSLAIMSFRA